MPKPTRPCEHNPNRASPGTALRAPQPFRQILNYLHLRERDPIHRGLVPAGLAERQDGELIRREVGEGVAGGSWHCANKFAPAFICFYGNTA
jgi:hypothetical protein